MTERLELADIQGNIVRAYGRFGFPHARYFLLHVDDPAAGRKLLRALEPQVTTAERWAGGPDDEKQAGVPRPKVTLNVAISGAGLAALGLPGEALRSLPEPLLQGMHPRAALLGDEGPSGIAHWDEVWRYAAADPGEAAHILVSMSAQMTEDGAPVPDLEERTDWLRRLASDSDGGVRLLAGHGPDGADFQQAGALLARREDGTMRTDPREHFGFVDGVGDPVFEGQFAPEAEARRVRGRGKIVHDGTWKPIATGEFVIGHVDESQELTAASTPDCLTRNGSFMAFRKLHEDVAAFEAFLGAQAETYAAARGVSIEEASETLRAKMVGRWSNGVPLMAAPTWADLKAFEEEWSDVLELRGKPDRTEAEEARVQAWKERLVDFRYRDDKQGLKCPIAAHIRRGNVRDYLDPDLYSDKPSEFGGTSISNRRRILRRGLPYGRFDPDNQDADGEHGIIFIGVCANLERQFEFVLQQWINYGMDNNSGNDTCPLLGTRPEDTKFVIQSEPGSDEAPYIMTGIPQFVTTRGGEYFFIPGLTALRMIATGTIDPI
ncbi:peroxidase [Sulfitobacter sp. D35]|uniref:Dyp-type peroxidase n=1 Tax=Sulfitobacter sp. D35 TaxID=3083252 RepID=UPI00296E81E8|nr:peroxidase [Sulfitobacter sp. D35]MDW4496499.1 peroxidase [Sulfitobacter sp. D35]